MQNKFLDGSSSGIVRVAILWQPLNSVIQANLFIVLGVERWSSSSGWILSNRLDYINWTLKNLRLLIIDHGSNFMHHASWTIRIENLANSNSRCLNRKPACTLKFPVFAVVNRFYFDKYIIGKLIWNWQELGSGLSPSFRRDFALHQSEHISSVVWQGIRKKNRENHCDSGLANWKCNKCSHCSKYWCSISSYRKHWLAISLIVTHHFQLPLSNGYSWLSYRKTMVILSASTLGGKGWSSEDISRQKPWQVGIWVQHRKRYLTKWIGRVLVGALNRVVAPNSSQWLQLQGSKMKSGRKGELIQRLRRLYW